MRISVVAVLAVVLAQAAPLSAQPPTTQPAEHIASLASGDADIPSARQANPPAPARAIQPAQPHPAAWGEELSPADREAVRSLLALMRQACRSGDETCLTAFMAPDEARLARFVLAAQRDHRLKMQELTRLARQARIDLPAELADHQDRLTALRDGDLKVQLRCPFLPGRAMAFGPPEPLQFKRAGQKWVFTLDLDDGQTANSRIELSQAKAQAAAELASGIAAGTITPDTFARHHVEVMARLVAPIVNQRMAFLVKRQ